MKCKDRRRSEDDLTKAVVAELSLPHEAWRIPDIKSKHPSSLLS